MFIRTRCNSGGSIPNEKSATKTTPTQVSLQVTHPGSSNTAKMEESEQNNSLGTPSRDKQPEESPQEGQYPRPPSWQRVPSPSGRKKRKICDSPPQAELHFSGLPLDADDGKNINNIPKPSKPPPIVLNGIEDLNELSKLLHTVSNKDQFKFKLINKFLLHILVNCADEYKKIISVIRANGRIGHTFTPKGAKCYRIVIKDLHHSTPHEEIIEAIEATNNKVKGEIINAHYGPDKKPTSTFFVNIEPSVNNSEVKNIKYIFNQKVKIEDPRKSKGIVQCHRC
jgi:hypothetical protein